MKPSIRLTALSLFGLLFITNASQAQNLLVANATAQGVNIISTPSIAGDLSATTLAESNPKLVRNFSKLFPSTENVAWSKLDNNFFVSFEKDGQPASAVFSNKGLLNYTITACNLQQLPASLQQKISKKYNGYDLFHASQIFSNGTQAYSIVLENSGGYVTLLHTEDGTEETRKVNKPTVN